MSAPERPRRRLGRPPKGERGDTRQALLDAALELFARQGYSGTSVRQIAEAVGVRDSALYAHFDAKRQLLETLVAQSGPDLIDQLGVDFGSLSEHDPAEVLPEFFRRLVEAWDRPRPRMMISMITREGLVGVSEVMEGVQARFLPHIRRWVEAAALRDDLPPEDLVWELVIPMGAIRLLHLHADADAGERRAGRERARRHIEYFVATATTNAP